MSGARPRRSGPAAPIAAGVMISGLCGALWAGERSIRATPQNYASAPVVARASSAVLIERRAGTRSASSSSTAAARPAPSRTLVSTSGSGSSQALVSTGDAGEASRFVSAQTVQTEQAPLEYWLKGEVRCWNKSPKHAEEFGLIVVPFDGYHNALSTGRINIARVKGWLVGGKEDTLDWEIPLNAPKVAEIAVAILTVRFGDGTIWKAPDVELVDFF